MNLKKLYVGVDTKMMDKTAIDAPVSNTPVRLVLQPTIRITQRNLGDSRYFVTPGCTKIFFRP